MRKSDKLKHIMESNKILENRQKLNEGNMDDFVEAANKALPFIEMMVNNESGMSIDPIRPRVLRNFADDLAKYVKMVNREDPEAWMKDPSNTGY